jgi:hypothetical protein
LGGAINPSMKKARLPPSFCGQQYHQQYFPVTITVLNLFVDRKQLSRRRSDKLPEQNFATAQHGAPGERISC